MIAIKEKLIFQLVINYKDGECKNSESYVLQRSHKKLSPSRNKSDPKVEAFHSPSTHAEKIIQSQQLKSIQ
jgi:hypothetical protein